MDVVARVDRRFDSSTILRLSILSFMLTGCRIGCIVSLYRAGEEKPTERYKTRVKVAEENKLYFFISNLPKDFQYVLQQWNLIFNFSEQ